MENTWNTKRIDLNTATDVLARHFEGTSAVVGLQEILVTPEGTAETVRPDWLIELEEIFEAKYGLDAGRNVTDRVLGALITRGEMVH